ncbi:MAG: hypothetical protein U1F65_06480 [Verrucomicrobiota bacterium]
MPLTTAATGRGDSRVSVVSQPKEGDTQLFRPLSAEVSTSPKPTVSHTGKACEPRVSIQREGDHVTGIRVHCSCGQVIDLACIY